MSELRLTEAQRRRFEDIRADLEAAYGADYTRVGDADVVAYLLDTYTPPTPTPPSATPATETAVADPAERDGATDAESDAPTAAPEDTDAPDASDDTDGTAAAGGGAARVSSMLRLLDDHADKWAEASSGDAPYEVELPDGSVEPARTKDDVRRILYQHY